MFGLDLMWLICHLASTWKSSLRGSISTCVWCGNLYMTWMIHVEATWKSSLRDSVSNRAFSKFKALLSLTNASPLSFTLSLTIYSFSLTDPLSLSQRHRRQPRPTLTFSASPTPTLAHPLTLSASPTPTHSHLPSHSLTHQPSLMPLSVTLSTLTQTPCHRLYSLTHHLYSYSVSTISHSSASPKEQRCIKRS